MEKDKKIELLEQIPINTNWPNLTLASLIGNKSPFYLPMVKESLDSEFCKGVKWIDLIGNRVYINGTIEIDGIKTVPIYVNPRVGNDEAVYLHTSLVLEPSFRLKIRVPASKEVTSPHLEEKKTGRRACSKPKRFHFNGMDYDMVKLYHKLPKMNESEVYNLKRSLVNSLFLLLQVDYIVTDTNNWCTESADKKGIKYSQVLERIATYIIKKGLSTKFLVLSEILTELKRLSKKHKPARLAQNLLNNSFMPRNLIYIPNPNENIPYDVIADHCIQRHVVRLYKEGKRLSVISNDQQAMMLFEASVQNSCIASNTPPNFLSLENINQLFNLLDKINKQ